MTTVIPMESKGDYKPSPPGSHIAVCGMVIDCGTQAFTWQGETKINPQIALGFELSEELMDSGKPFTISAIMTMSSHEKAKLRQFLEAWRGVAFTDADFGKFDIAKLLGIGCMLNVTQTTKDGKIKSKISGIMRLPKGTAAPKLVAAPVHFTLDAFNQETYDGLSPFWRELIAKSPEYKQLKGEGIVHHQEAVTGHLDDEIPF